MGPLVAPGVIGLVSGLEQAGIQSQQRQRQRILNAQLDKTARVQQQGASDVLGEAQTMSPAARLAAMQAAEDQTAAQTEKDLSGVDPVDTSAGAGNQSQAFLSAKADRALSEGNRLTALARAAAKARSVGQVQQNEGLRRSALAEALGSMYSTDRADANAAGMEADSVGMPWYGQLGHAVTTAGNAARSKWAGR